MQRGNWVHRGWFAFAVAGFAGAGCGGTQIEPVGDAEASDADTQDAHGADVDLHPHIDATGAAGGGSDVPWLDAGPGAGGDVSVQVEAGPDVAWVPDAEPAPDRVEQVDAALESGPDTQPGPTVDASADASPTPDTDAYGAADTGADVDAATVPLGGQGPVTCGDGIVECRLDDADRYNCEQCDDGNGSGGDGCSEQCVVEPGWVCTNGGEPCHQPRCGDAVIESYRDTADAQRNEACDDGNTNDGDGCSSNCAVESGWVCVTGEPCRRPVCGDGRAEGTEACDDGNLATGDGCSSGCVVEIGWICPPNRSCELRRCGDGIAERYVDPSGVTHEEGCDDGNSTSGDGCSSTCSVEPRWLCPTPGQPCVLACGNGRLDDANYPREQCDDGNVQAGDGCSATCLREAGWACPTAGQPCRPVVCGDGVAGSWTDENGVVRFKDCDDGNALSGDGCSATCQFEPGWACDTFGAPCRPIVCGDGRVDKSREGSRVVSQEPCDDGNVQSGDGCSSTCQLEPGWICPNAGQACRSSCGNGVIDCWDNENQSRLCEACDDKNVLAGDGCSSNCTLEPGWFCVNAGRACEQVSPLADVTGVAIGAFHTCAIKTDGTLWCWGDNLHGQLGDGTTTSRYAPVQVTSLSNSAAQVSAGWYHTCAVKTDGTLWCWGYNMQTQLGQSTAMVSSSVPIEIAATGSAVAQVVASGYWTGVVGADGQMWYWGQVGGTTRPPQPLSSQPAAQLTATGIDSLCARNADSILFCMGVLPEAFGPTVAQVAIGQSHACARKTDGSLWCWGNNTFGQLGDGTTTRKDVPIQVAALGNTVVDVSAGIHFTCAKRSDGSAWCWGQNDYGQIGNETRTNTPVPSRVAALGDSVRGLYANWYHACATKTDNTLWCWGDNAQRQLGDGTTNHQSVPVQVGVASTPRPITCRTNAVAGANAMPVRFSRQTGEPLHGTLSCSYQSGLTKYPDTSVPSTTLTSDAVLRFANCEGEWNPILEVSSIGAASKDCSEGRCAREAGLAGLDPALIYEGLPFADARAGQTCRTVFYEDFAGYVSRYGCTNLSKTCGEYVWSGEKIAVIGGGSGPLTVTRNSVDVYCSPGTSYACSGTFQ